MPDNVKLHIVNMVLDFSKYQNKLIEAFKRIYKIIDVYHSTNEEILSKITNQLKDETLDGLRESFKIQQDTFPNHFYFSALNGFLLHYRIFKSETYFGLGTHFKMQVDQRYSLKHVSLFSFGKAVSNPMRFDIMCMFLRYKRLCAADIAHELGISKSTVYLHINAIHAEEIIEFFNQEEKVNGERVFYTINPNYFKILAELVIETQQKADNIVAGIDEYDRSKKKRKPSIVG